MAAATNLQVLLESHGSPSKVLRLAEAPRPTPGPGQVLVRMKLRPINPADHFSILGVYPGFQPKEYPAVPGLEGVGVVEENGPGASKFAVGQRVVGTPFDTIHGGSGTWQQYMLVGEGCLAAVPDAVSDDAAAQAWINPVTTVGMVDEVLKVPAGEWLLQTAAASVLGRQVIQLAKHRGIKTINVVRREQVADELKALGADEVVVSADGEGLVERVQEITGGRGAYAAIECVGGELFAKVAAAVRSGGTCIIYGAMSGLTATYNIPDVLFRDVVVRGFWLIPYMAGLPAAERERVMATVLQLLADGIITPYSGERFPLDQVVAAAQASKVDARGGKVLLEG